jgi:hypothetical protein
VCFDRFPGARRLLARARVALTRPARRRPCLCAPQTVDVGGARGGGARRCGSIPAAAGGGARGGSVPCAACERSSGRARGGERGGAHGLRRR